MPADGKWLDALDDYGTADETPGYVPGEKSDGTGFHPPKSAGPSGSWNLTADMVAPLPVWSAPMNGIETGPAPAAADDSW